MLWISDYITLECDGLVGLGLEEFILEAQPDTHAASDIKHLFV